MWCLFTVLMMSCWTKVPNFNTLQFVKFSSFMVSTCCVLLKKHLPAPKSQGCTLFSYKRLIVWYFIIRSASHLEWFLCMMWGRGQDTHFSCGYLIDQHCLLKHHSFPRALLCSPPSEVRGLLCPIAQLIFLPKPNCLNCHSLFLVSGSRSPPFCSSSRCPRLVLVLGVSIWILASACQFPHTKNSLRGF